MNLHPAMPEKQQSSNPGIFGVYPFILVPSWKEAFLEQEAMTRAGTYTPLCLKNSDFRTLVFLVYIRSYLSHLGRRPFSNKML